VLLIKNNGGYKMTNGYRRGYGPQASGFYSPYSKNIQWGQGISELLNNMMMMKQFRQAQEQQKWQRGITEQESTNRSLESRLLGLFKIVASTAMGLRRTKKGT